jgi:phosphoribosylglycinamide formyltransferase-1
MESIINHFRDDKSINVISVFSNKPNCLALVKAKKLGVNTFVFSKTDLENGSVTNELHKFSPTLIVLAGFLLKIPQNLVREFPNKIINIHPALLPKYGGKGMYGKHVHKAVIENKETESGITIHYVNEHYDQGNIIKQFTCDVDSTDTVELLQAKIHGLEQNNFALTIQKLLNEN